jgi:glycosyltransferase involved in cell wall biosynthesis
VRDLHPDVAVYRGAQSIKKMPEIYRNSDALLVPSHYEPGSLVVGEALASGLPVVASTQVGPIEVLSPDTCRVFESGDLDDFERQVRAMVADLRAGRAPELAEAARREAETLFSPRRIGDDLHRILRDVTKARG